MSTKYTDHQAINLGMYWACAAKLAHKKLASVEREHGNLSLAEYHEGVAAAAEQAAVALSLNLAEQRLPASMFRKTAA
jgi:hypothetical protein